LHRAALRELIKIDLEYRWFHEQAIYLEDYLARFPQLGPAHELPVDLIYEEFSTRHRFRDRPDLESYRDRFPRQFPKLQDLVREKPAPTFVQPTVLAQPADAADDL